MAREVAEGRVWAGWGCMIILVCEVGWFSGFIFLIGYGFVMRMYRRPVCPECGRGEDVVLVWSVGNFFRVVIAVVGMFFTGIDPVRLRWKCKRGGCGCSFMKRGS